MALTDLLYNVSCDLNAAYEMFCFLISGDWKVDDEKIDAEMREALERVVWRCLEESKRQVDCVVDPESRVVKGFEEELLRQRSLITVFHT